MCTGQIRVIDSRRINDAGYESGSGVAPDGAHRIAFWRFAKASVLKPTAAFSGRHPLAVHGSFPYVVACGTGALPPSCVVRPHPACPGMPQKCKGHPKVAIFEGDSATRFSCDSYPVGAMGAGKGQCSAQS